MAMTGGGLKLVLPPCFHHRRKTTLRVEQPTKVSICAALSKQGHRFFTSVATTDDPATASRLIRKFVASSSKSVALDAIAHLVSPVNTFTRLSPLAFSLYYEINKASWFNWNAKLISDVIASLHKHQRFNEAHTLILEVETKLGSKERDICNFYCNLMDSHSKHQSKQGILESYERIKQIPSHSSSIYLQKRSYESIIGCLSTIDLPNEAETLMVEMKNKGLKASIFEYRSISYAYGRLGLFEEMKRVIGLMEKEGFKLDVIMSNMVLSSLGFHNELTEMVLWLKRMKTSRIPFSIRTYNSVLNNCPTIMSIIEHPKEIKPTSLQELLKNLKDDEKSVIQELVDPLVLSESMELTSLELKLDLHGMHLGCAYMILLQWFDDVRIRYGKKNHVIPNKVVVVCGVGKHSVVRGESPVKELVKEMMRQMKSPLKIDRKNVGCFVANGNVFMNWLCQAFST
ncbi:hypothetical protein LXL04_009688 [Taraxacum kok-saghyz]